MHAEKAREFSPTNFNTLDKTGILEMHALLDIAAVKSQLANLRSLMLWAFLQSGRKSPDLSCGELFQTFTQAQTLLPGADGYYRPPRAGVAAREVLRKRGSLLREEQWRSRPAAQGRWFRER